MYLDEGLACGGSERVAERLLGYWVSRGWRVFLISRASPESGFFSLPSGVQGFALSDASPVSTGVGSDRKGPLRALLLLPGMAPIRTIARLLYEAVQLRRILGRIDPDVSVALLTPANVKLVLAASWLRTGVVVSERNDTRSYRYPWIWHVLRRATYRQANVVTANLAVSIDDMKSYVPYEKLTFVPNPVELPSDTQIARPAQSQRIVCVGRLVPYKRHRLLLNLFARLGVELEGWNLDIVGDGPLHAELEAEIADLGLAERVQLHGRQYDVGVFYRAGAVFILPSIVEGTPNALLEAMGHGLPCVVSDAVTGAVSYIEDGVTGFSFRSESSTDLADRVRRLVREPKLREKMGLAARQRIQKDAQQSAYPVWDRVVRIAMAPAVDEPASR
jgi:glycosyltransferase involved in cell wall biosynthesis